MPVSTPLSGQEQPDDVQYHYDEDGLVEAVEAGGQSLELTDAQKQRFPGQNSLPETRSTQTAIRSTVEDIKESYGNDFDFTDAHDEDTILVDVEATHGGYYNRNNYYYRFSGMEDMVGTWTAGGGRPFLSFHDKKSKSHGRVVGARAVKTVDTNDFGEPMGFHLLDVRVGDDNMIERILDGRALHVSVGSRPVDTVECRICQHDLYHDGRGAARYELDGQPSDEILNRDAPGIFGRLGMTYEDFYKIEETDEGTWTARCRHVRGHEAPMGQDRLVETGWRLHGNRYKELSEVNEPADVNEETGEYAHIRGLKEQEDSFSDEAMDKLITDDLAQTPGPTDHARFTIASEKDLWRPRTANEAKDHVQSEGPGKMFDTSLWTAVNARHKSMADKIEAYWQKGGRFVGAETDTTSSDTADNTGSEVTFADALDMNPREFGNWLRQQDMSREDERELDKVYTKANM